MQFKNLHAVQTPTVNKNSLTELVNRQRVRITDQNIVESEKDEM